MRIVLVGDREHPEIIGVNGWCGNTAIIIDGSEMIGTAMDTVGGASCRESLRCSANDF
jgi:4-hydroxy-3-methylbut-2-enyl diphosphate reductase